ncbi:CopG family transcriptional regulator [Methylotuvimicrobium sp.]|uniref:ribbon-helix-helix domain-containing protein n=1 Tax=Methylotuvimicrobium sp. TaxID=2822413 RepID=UPI003D65034C
MTKHYKDKPLKRITVNLDQDDYLQMEQIAKNGRVSTAWLIRKAINEFLERQQEDKNINITIKSVD